MQREEEKLKKEQYEKELMIGQIENYEEIDRCMNLAINSLLEDLKDANNEYQNIIGSIRVFVRIRPFIPFDHPEDQISSVISVTSRNDMVLKVPLQRIRSENHQTTYGFSFERVYAHNETQDNLFTELSSLIQSSIDGYNVCIFSYGQTGAGKTYTMLGGGEKHNQGLLPRTVAMLFDRAKALERAGFKCSFGVCFSEIYNNKMVDLLDDKRAELTELISCKLG